VPADSPGRGAPEAGARRPLALLFVYTWDILSALLVFFIALAAFGGGREQQGRVVSVPLAVQILQALAFVALGAALIIVGTLLTRRQAWVRRAQIGVLAMKIVLESGSTGATWVVDASARTWGTLLGSLLLVLLDLLALLAVTGPRLRAWFTEPGEIPLYLGSLVVFWAAASVAFFILDIVS